ncbi:acyloxyacyl hydrolase [Rhodohalobacter halophilus]|uniref:acyloxyacyl hydrolase n=1 Tax=Rhodohalobacter halophilus TaxID=1812810 RepID=UPI00083FC9C0|nr:acyloxyacyl hydrolase [Rhodohalobacter halophilus]
MELLFKFRTLPVVALILLLPFSKGAAQQPDLTETSSFNPSFTISGSFAPYSFRAWGKVKNSQQLFLKVGYSYTELDLLSFRTQLGSELIVSGIVNYPLDGNGGERNTLYGFGFLPLIANMPLNQNLNHPFVTSSAGFIVTNSQFPNINGARLNFMLGLGAGYQFTTDSNNSFQVGWKLSHMSNAFIAPENPGIDSIMLFVNFLL